MYISVIGGGDVINVIFILINEVGLMVVVC